MKSFTQIFTTLLALLAFFTTVSVALSDRDACSKKAPAAMSAIDQFCREAGNNLNVPSNFAAVGKRGRGPLGLMKVMILANCSPAQWIPNQYCWSQFYSICVRGSPRGGGMARYGNNGCQLWSISADF